MGHLETNGPFDFLNVLSSIKPQIVLKIVLCDSLLLWNFMFLTVSCFIGILNQGTSFLKGFKTINFIFTFVI